MYKKLSKDPDKYLLALFQAGWMDEWEEEEIAALEGALKKNKGDYIVFSLTEYRVRLDAFTSPKAYKDFLNDLVRVFEIPLEIAERDGDIFFKGGGVDSSYRPEVDKEGFPDMGILDFFNDEVLYSLGERRIFYPLPPLEDVMELVFLYPHVSDKAEELGIIPPPDYFA